MALFTIAMLSQTMADETISVDTQLSADMTVGGTLYLKNGATLDLNGHNLSVKALARPVVEGEDVPGYSFIECVESTGHQWLYSDYRLLAGYGKSDGSDDWWNPVRRKRDGHDQAWRFAFAQSDYLVDDCSREHQHGDVRARRIRKRLRP